MPRARYTLTSPRFPQGVPCEVLRLIPGTECWLVAAQVPGGGTTAYATESELTACIPSGSRADWATRR